MTSDLNQANQIAIIAVEGRFPGARDIDAFWSMIRDGRCAVEDVDEDILRKAGIDSSAYERSDYVRKTLRLEGYDEFALEFFGYNHRQATDIDPQHRLFLEGCWTALERAACDPERFPGAIGVFAAAAPNRYALARLGRLLEKRDWAQWTQETIDSEKDFLSTRVSYKLDLTGPSITVQTACSSSLVAIHLACQSLRQYECDLALAGGVSIVYPQGLGYRAPEGGIAAQDGLCRPFDRSATGTIAGSGLGIVVLKRLEDALKDRDMLLAIIRGSAINNDGARKAGYTAPSRDGQTEAIKLALGDIDPSTIGLIEAHGTGTKLGDAVELSSLESVFAGSRCALGSVKANIGHLDAASGVAGLIKATQCLTHRQIPPQINFTEPNLHLKADSDALYLNLDLRSWDNGPNPRRAAISSFGMGGTNAHVVIEEAITEPGDAVADSDQLFVLSAKTKKALHALRERLAEQLQGEVCPRLCDVAYTQQVGRAVLDYRTFVVARDRGTLIDAMREPDARLVHNERRNVPLMLVFPSEAWFGTDSLSGLCRTDAALQARLEACSSFVRTRSGIDLAGSIRSGDVSAAGETAEQYGAYMLVAFCLAQLLRNMGLEVRAAIGEGVGLCVASAMTHHVDEADFLEWVSDFLSRPDPLAFSVPLPWEAGEPKRQVSSAAGGVALVFGGSGQPAGPLREQIPFNYEICSLNETLGTGGRRSLLMLLGELWLAGVGLFPDRQNVPEQPRRVLLPTYPFERRRCWLDDTATAPVQEHTAAPQADTERLHGQAALSFYAPSWTPAAGPISKPSPGESWVIFGDRTDLLEQTVQAVRDIGVRVVIVGSDSRFVAVSRDGYRIRLDCLVDYQELWQRLSNDGFQPDVIINATALDWHEARRTGTSPKEIFLRLLYSVQAFVGIFGSRSAKLLVATRGMYVGPGICVTDPAPSVLVGLVKVITQELSIPTKLVDLPNPDDSPVFGTFDRRTCRDLIAEASDCVGTQIVAYRGARRFVQGYAPLDATSMVPGMVRKDRVFLITGGLGSIGLELVERLARHHGSRLILITRLPFPERENWQEWLDSHGPTDGVAQKIRRLLALEEAGSRIIVSVADITCADELADALRHAEKSLGRIQGVFHLAADTRHPSIRRLIIDIKPDDFARQSAPKIEAFDALDEVLAEHELDLAVAFSSNASVLGGYGFGAYAAVNAYLDHAAVAINRKSRIGWRVINWDGWREGAEDSENPYTMSMEQGLDALERVVGLSSVPQVIVAVGDFSARMRTWLDSGKGDQPLTQRLAAPETSVAKATAPAALSKLEQCVCDIWQDVLGGDSAGLNKQFHELGGDSLVAMRMMERLGDAIGFEIPLGVFLRQGLTASILCQEIKKIVKDAVSRTSNLKI